MFYSKLKLRVCRVCCLIVRQLDYGTSFRSDWIQLKCTGWHLRTLSRYSGHGNILESALNSGRLTAALVGIVEDVVLGFGACFGLSITQLQSSDLPSTQTSTSPRRPYGLKCIG